MLRLFLILHLFFFNVYACKGGYDFCVKKAKDAKIIHGRALFIPVEKNHRIVFSRQKPQSKILKHDPFLSLYLIEEKTSFAYPYDLNMRLQLGTAIVNAEEAKEGSMLVHQVGLDFFGKYSQKLSLPAIISSSCCSLEAVVSKKGVIEKEYLQYFLKTEKVRYADIGVRVNDANRSVVVIASDPYMPDNPFKKGDCILYYDNKKVKNAASFMRKVLFGSLGVKHTVQIKRGGKLLTFEVQSRQRYGGGFLSDTFLEQKGIYFDEGLHVSRLKKAFKNYGLKTGDRLIQVNGITVKNQEELRKYIENFKDYSSLLFERNNFQFFVKIK
ncbi:DUF7488 domain-containing protein [Sulfurimonas sp. ST-27]|uniref:DUF7488 domain-containing protein n=1 Tax=Sulfurimonas sp. ST-27 TaxID=3400152 RepID=UPI003AB35C5D